MGDPLGIGPEIIVQTLLGASSSPAALGYRVRLYADPASMLAAATLLGRADAWTQRLALPEVQLVDLGIASAERHAQAQPTSTRFGGLMSFAAMERAIVDAKRPTGDPQHIDAIVTAPISKTSWNLADKSEFPGHTELLAARFAAPDSGMLFVGPSLRVMLASIHVPLARVTQVLSSDGILRAIRLADRACKDMGIARPRIGVCGINPHAGEGGILGTEDETLITPAIARSRDEGIDATGPHPGDTVFSSAVIPPRGPGRYDAIVAMYHDQGLIPVKLMDGREAVNVTVGLPTIRTSPAHGTAFDIAGTGKADATSMIAAVKRALDMLKRRQRRTG